MPALCKPYVTSNSLALGGAWAAAPCISMSGQCRRTASQSNNTSAASPSQVVASPWPSRSGTSSAPATMPVPTPAITSPPAVPRRCGATLAWVAGPASAISNPPATPATPRHAISQPKPPFQAQAAKASTTSAMPKSSVPGTPIRRATARPPKVPTR